jgi:hypothetical protein
MKARMDELAFNTRQKHFDGKVQSHDGTILQSMSLTNSECA